MYNYFSYCGFNDEERLQNAISREEHTQNLGIRGRAFGYQKLLTCISTSIL